MAFVSRLICHPAHPCAAVTALHVNTSVSASGGLQLRFELSGAMDALHIPAAAQSGFADELWKHTCFEAFVSAPDALTYREFNFSPSGQWAAYDFGAYRQRNASWQALTAPRLSSRVIDKTLTLDADIPPELLPAATSQLHIGLTSVIEARDGSLSYWALAHPGERPDFHQRAGFTLRIADTTQP